MDGWVCVIVGGVGWGAGNEARRECIIQLH